MLQSLGFGTLTVAGSAVAFTDGSLTPNPAKPPILADCYVESGDIRVKTSGGTPAAGVGGGKLIPDGTHFWVEDSDSVMNFKAIREVTSATINYELFEEA